MHFKPPPSPQSCRVISRDEMTPDRGIEIFALLKKMSNYTQRFLFGFNLPCNRLCCLKKKQHFCMRGL